MPVTSGPTNRPAFLLVIGGYRYWISQPPARNRCVPIVDVLPLRSMARSTIIWTSELNLRRLEQPRWKGHSDTETLLYAIRHWGIKDALQRFNGMFAFAIWDTRSRALTLCRDRFGEKPLFYGWVGGELSIRLGTQGVCRSPELGKINRSPRAHGLHMRYSYVPAPWTIWEGFRKLVSGSFVVISQRTNPGDLPQPEAYWSMRQQVVYAGPARSGCPIRPPPRTSSNGYCLRQWCSNRFPMCRSAHFCRAASIPQPPSH